MTYQLKRLQDATPINRAIDAIREALPTYGSSAFPRLSLVDLYMSKGEIPAARAALDEARKCGAGASDIALRAARLAEWEGDLKTALTDMTDAVAARPANAELQMEYGALLERCGLRREAKRAFQSASRLDPHNRQARKKASLFNLINIPKWLQSRSKKTN